MRIVLGVTGGIAAYKAVFIARNLVEAGHEVHVVPTEDSLHFVGLATWEAISRHPVTTSVHDGVAEVRHVALGQQADLIIVAPATANTLAAMATGLANNLLGTTLLASRAPVLVAPAMHSEMWEHPATRANVATLRERGVRFIGPDSGRLTGADSGPGRMSEPEAIVEAALNMLQGDTGEQLSGVRVLVSAGGTREAIDPVRFIGNRSSGRQGVEIALAVANCGATVDLVAANIDARVLEPTSSNSAITVHRVESTLDLQASMTQLSHAADVVIMAAAVADYRVAQVSETKITKEGRSEPPAIELVENPDVIAELIASKRDGQLFVAFAAETTPDDKELLERARRKRARKGADLIAVNRVGWLEGFETDSNTLTVIDASDQVIGRFSGTKQHTACELIDAIVALR